MNILDVMPMKIITVSIFLMIMVFKLFNSNKVELIKGHNVFTVLKKMEYLHDSSFEKAEK